MFHFNAESEVELGKQAISGSVSKGSDKLKGNPTPAFHLKCFERSRMC